MTCLVPKYSIVVQCQSFVYVLNKHEKSTKIEKFRMLTNYHDTSEA